MWSTVRLRQKARPNTRAFSPGLLKPGSWLWAPGPGLLTLGSRRGLLTFGSLLLTPDFWLLTPDS